MSAHDVPAEPEPKTPVWLTVVGACLFLALAVWWLAPHAAEPDATVRVPAPTADAPAPTEVPAAGAPTPRPPTDAERGAPTPTP